VTDPRLAVIVLAAGQGTRMKSSLPKLMHPLAGLPIISHVLATARALDAAHVVTVLRHERERLAELVALDLPESLLVEQDEIPGTGRAVEQAIAALPADFDGDVLVVSGDVPLLNAATLTNFIAAHRERAAAATVLSAFPTDVTGYGRIIRSDDGTFDRIVEHKDATDD
jgi:bifunctional UDP-N-acetylglucosamine pyrophosphorylase/glucosamine-1-phosphate N-acetyltransferase